MTERAADVLQPDGNMVIGGDDDGDGVAMRIALAVLNDVAAVLRPPLRPQDAMKVMVPHPRGTLAALQTPGHRFSISGTVDRMLRCHVVCSSQEGHEHAVHEFHVGRTTVEKLMTWPRLPADIGAYIAESLPSSRAKALLVAATQEGEYQVRWVRQSCDARRMQVDAASSPRVAFKTGMYNLRPRTRT